MANENNMSIKDIAAKEVARAEEKRTEAIVNALMAMYRHVTYKVREDPKLKELIYEAVKYHG